MGLEAREIVADARLHDLRHAHASPHAVMNGESLHVAGRPSRKPARQHH